MDINLYNHNNQFQYQSINIQNHPQSLNDDWAFIQQNSNNNSKTKSQNMLSNLSNNLITYQNSYKKQLKYQNINSQKNKINSQSIQNIKKRKLVKRKINFSFDIQNNQPNQQNISQLNKQNTQQQINLHKSNKTTAHNQLGNNLIRLDKMFKILKQFNTLNQTILPFKVNLNKVSQKRILANMAFKQFNQQNKNNLHSRKKTEPFSINLHQDKSIKNTIDTEFVPLKRRIYSLDIRNKDQTIRKDIKPQPISTTNNIFSYKSDSNNENLKNSKQFTRRKRTYSVRKTQHQICQKTIQEIRDNHSRRQSRKTQYKNNSTEKNDNKQKQNEYFSDSRFFTKGQEKKQLKSQLKRQGLSQINVLIMNNCIKK